MPLIQPDIRPIKENGDLYRLEESYCYELLGVRLCVPAGFEYDGASYSRILFQRDGVHRAACLVHDYLYTMKGEIGPLVYTRYQADQCFKRLLKEAGVKNLHVFLAYSAVRLFGGVYWNG